MDKKINVISDLEGNEIIIINDIRFKGKRRIDWENVEQYLKEYIGNCYEVVETSDHIFIGSDFPRDVYKRQFMLRDPFDMHCRQHQTLKNLTSRCNCCDFPVGFISSHSVSCATAPSFPSGPVLSA